ncbi:unnamed protein product [Linum tenue]|uniref:Bet v I/Major latex protein domain-containing protein n=1 Tax=Linum tenue TaxID=586396 RepID=A0AAV0LKZ4_9ROSI|nr:unnamed protein product [Linum tenue]
MAMKGKLQSVMEVKASANKVYQVWKASYDIPKLTAENIHKVEVQQGDWETTGSIKYWCYTLDGKLEVLKEKTFFDDEKKLVTVIGADGDPMKLYKVYIGKFEMKPKDDDDAGGNGCFVTITVEYEKLNLASPPAYKYLDFLESVVHDLGEALA